MSLLFFKPKPRFSLIARLSDGPGNQKRYLLITECRWMCPPGRYEKEWVYDGILVEQDSDKPLQLVNRMQNVTQDRLERIPAVKFIPGFPPG